MPKSLYKVQKHITKKKGQNATLHAHSRDSRMILRANARDNRVEKMNALKERANLPYLHRVMFFQDQLFPQPEDDSTDELPPVQVQDISAIQELVQLYLSRHDEELEEIKAARRPGRPATSRDDILSKAVDTDRKEYAKGLWIPDLSDEGNLGKLREWKGEWVGLNTLKFVRIDGEGVVKQSNWPPRGNS